MRKNNDIPTQQDINDLATEIARDGLHANTTALEAVLEVAASTELIPATVEVLRHPSAPEIAKARAFAVLARNWPDIRRSAMRRFGIDRAFGELVTRWTDHQKLKDAPEPAIDQLWLSRQQLEESRTMMALARSPR